MRADQMGGQVGDAPKRLARAALDTYNKARKAIKAIKLAVKLVKAVLVALKALLAFLLAGGWTLVVLGLFLLLVYVIILSPATVNKELVALQKEGAYAGRALSYFLDVDDRWTEELDRAAHEKYEGFKDKCLENLDSFQASQAAPYALPHALLIAIERVELFLNEEGGEWFPDPGTLYEPLRTRYEWKGGQIDYHAAYRYDFNYSYNWDEHIPPSFDRQGRMTSPGRTITHFVSGSGADTQSLHFPFEVKLISRADAYDNIFVYSYDDYVVDEGVVAGTWRQMPSGETIDTLDQGLDGHENVLLDTNLKDEIKSHAEGVRSSIKSGFHPGAYNVKFEFGYEVTNATKRYRPVNSVSAEGVQFGRLKGVLDKRLGHEVDPLDLEMIFHIAVEYDEDFSYNFAANAGAGYFAPSIYYDGYLAGGLAWPIPGLPGTDHYITSKFGPRWGAFHGGVDIGAHGGNVPILSAMDGVVAFAGRAAGFGNTVIVDHGLGDHGRITTLYAHLHNFNVRAGQNVLTGERVGTMGNTGRSFGTHLHFEIRIDNTRVNPLRYFPAHAYQEARRRL